MVCNTTAFIIVILALIFMLGVMSLPCWNVEHKLEYQKIVSGFGAPTYLNPMPNGVAIWRRFNKCSPFVRIMIVDESVPHKVSETHFDFIYTTIKYHIDPKKYMDVMSISDTIMYDRLKEELTVRCRSFEETIATMVLVDKIHSDLIKFDDTTYKKYMQDSKQKSAENYRILQLIRDKHDYSEIDYSNNP